MILLPKIEGLSLIRQSSIPELLASCLSPDVDSSYLLFIPEDPVGMASKSIFKIPDQILPKKIRKSINTFLDIVDFLNSSVNQSHLSDFNENFAQHLVIFFFISIFCFLFS